MENFKIEKGIEMPNKKENKYPFLKMEVGDSFFVPCEKIKVNKTSCSIHSLAKANCKRANLDYKFTVSGSENGVRIWRIK